MNTALPRPTVFVGSSKEGLSIAEAVQVNLDHACEVTLWSQGVFGLGEGTLESLVDRLEGFDFAVLVLTPDDVTESRKSTQQSPRDNVLLELGLFPGALGRQRTFILYDRGSKIKLPTDLAGVTAATYQLHTSGNLQSSLGAATTSLKSTIQQLGRRREKISVEVEPTTQFQVIHDLFESGPEQFLIWMHESGRTIQRGRSHLSSGIRYTYEMGSHAAGQGYFSMNDLCRKLADAALLNVDLHDNVSLTLRGKQFAQWLIDNGHKAVYFKSDAGEWGSPSSRPPFVWPPSEFLDQFGPHVPPPES